MKAYRHCVRVLIFKDNKVLLCTRKDGKEIQNYEFPGGGIETNDSFEESVIKECLEEVGIRVNNVQEINLTIVHDIKDLEYTSTEKYLGNINNYARCDFVEEDKSVYNIERDALPYEWLSVSAAIKKILDGPVCVFNKDLIEALYIVLKQENMKSLNNW